MCAATVSDNIDAGIGILRSNLDQVPTKMISSDPCKNGSPRHSVVVLINLRLLALLYKTLKRILPPAKSSEAVHDDYDMGRLR
jgi:hypothetical protein